MFCPTPASSARSLDYEQEELNSWLKLLPRPTGIMVCNDQWGQIVLESCRQLQMVVPEEIAIVGVNNDEPLCAVCDPPLSSVRPRHNEVGYEAARLLDHLMQGGDPPAGETLVAGGEVLTRRSSDAQAVYDPDVAAALRFIYEYACDGFFFSAEGETRRTMKVGDVVELCGHFPQHAAAAFHRHRRAVDPRRNPPRPPGAPPHNC